jgi:hypothetical protein
VSGRGARRGLSAEQRLEQWRKRVGGNRKYWNTVTELRRRERTLKNSMAHTPKPRPADVIRWRRMANEIADLRANAERIKPGHAAHRNTGGPDASSSA